MMTIQRRLWISNLILIAITILLLIGVSLIITENFRKFIGFPARADYREPPIFNRALLRADRTIMKTIESEPDQLLDPDYIHQIDDFLNSSSTALMVKKEDSIIYFSPFLAEIDITLEQLIEQAKNPVQNPDNIIKLSDTLFMKIIPFQFTDQTEGTLFLVNDATPIFQELDIFKKSIIYTLILFLIIMISINTLITYLLSKQIVNPLTRLQKAAQEIQKGNYDFQLEAPSKDEIGALFQSFEEARKQLKKSEETKKKYEQNRNELITNISHDLKTPITTIKGYIEGIMDGVPKSKEKQDKYLQTIHQNVVHMESLIEDLFLLSKFDLDQSLYQFENINIKNYLADSFEELHFDLQEKGIKLEYRADYDEQKLVKADRQQLKRVILNIINNAINYKNENNPTIQMILTEQGDEALVEIRDNGKGVSKEILDKIFERFYKEDKARSNQSPGSGLGLYIAHKIILDHGGKIWAESKTGSGTSIFFTLKKVEQNNINIEKKEMPNEKNSNH
jgi:histidine kinase